MIPEKLKLIAEKIDEAAKVKSNNQKEILNYCRDKSYDLSERFEFWEKYAIKNYSSWILRSNDFKSPLLGYFIEKANDIYERRDIIDYDTILVFLEDFELEELVNFPEIKRDLTIESILEDKPIDFSDENNIDFIKNKMFILLKEDIIKENFGEYRIDW